MSVLVHEGLDTLLVDVPACPLCDSMQGDAETSAPANLYSEQLALVVGCDEARLLDAVRNRRCADCGLWYKPRWFRPEALHTLFTERVPGHPKGWDAVSDRFSEQGFAREVDALRRAVDADDVLMLARYRRSLTSIVDSIVGIEGEPLQRHLLDAIAGADADALDRLKPELHGRFTEPVAFKRFSGFSSRLLWEWMEAHIGPVHAYGEVGCPLWGQLARSTGTGVQRYFFQRAENNYWGDGCCQGGQHCSQRLAADGGVVLHAWPPTEDTRLDAIGAFQYLDHLESPGRLRGGCVPQRACAAADPGRRG
ncbi:MAG: hypothetical protein QM769_04825 [Pseudoxanthomonas sp.]